VTDLSDYELSPLREGELPLHRGRRDGLSPILVVALQERNASAESVRRLEHEYALRAELDIGWAARPVALTRHHGRVSLVLEDPGGEPLDRLCGRPWAVADFLRIAIPLASALRQVHDRGLVHRDIKPANMLVDVASGGVWLTGFGCAASAPRERAEPDPTAVMAGTLAYMAPEQTGRMNRSADSRSDLYALGVTLYELLTGALPFTASDAMELIHSHIAQQPVAPDERVSAIPAQLSAIVLKLLAKTAEQRYQTAAGLEADLARCLALYQSHGRMDPFPLGERDAPDRLVISGKLYGREAATEGLFAAFDRVAALGGTGVVFVSGESGAGKSSVVNELAKALLASRRQFASGKFDQFVRDIPYSTVAQAFQSLVRSRLGASEAELRPWRNRLREALGLNGQLIVNLVPQLEVLIGKQPPVADLPPRDAQRRFQMVFRRFLGVFASEEHPLVLFLDDLQWLDAATLELLEHLATHPEVRSLLLIGAYRSGEVGPSHPLTQSIAAIREAKVDVREIALASLSAEDVGQLVADALHCEPQRARPLAELLHEKTAGNPFFAVQFLTSLVDEELLVFDSTASAWRWDVGRIRAKSYSENVVDLMAEKLGRLSSAAQNALMQLACLGATADIATLALVGGQTAEAMDAALGEAVKAGLIVRQEGVCSFLHDRIQQAAYALIPERRRAELHLGIGRRLLASLSADELSERPFDVVSQFNRGADQPLAGDEKARVASLNLQAGRKAKASAAYASAAIYLAAGATLLGEAGWDGQYDLLLQLQLARAECEFLRSNFDEAEQLIGELIDHAASRRDQATVYFLKVQLQVVKSEYSQAIASALICLNSFDIVIPPHPSWDQVQAEYDEMWRNLQGRPIENLLDLPLMTDPDLLAAMHLLSNLFDAAGFSDFNLSCLQRCRMVNLTLQHGVSGASAAAFGFLATTLGPVFGRYGDAYKFARVGCDLVEKHGFAADEARVHQAMGMVAMWTQPIGTALDFVRSACRTTTEAGDFTPACYSYPQIVATRLLRNDPLEAVWRESETGLDFVRSAGFHEIADMIVSYQRFIANMQGRTATFSTFNDAQFDEASFEARLPGRRGPARYWILKLKARFLSGDYAEALDAAEKAKALLQFSLGQAAAALDYFLYTALTVAELYGEASDDARTEWRDLLEAHQTQLREWAEIYPPTFGGKHALVAAEIARIEGRDGDAMRLYEQAIQSAREHEFVQDEGLAQEVAARFYAARGFETIARAYLRGSRRCYLRWGAEGKVGQLEQRHPHLGEAPIPRPFGVTVGAPAGRLDVETVVKASQTLSSEIRLGELIRQLMRITLEHAGAERGVLVLLRDGELKIEAVAVTGHGEVEVSVRQFAVTASDLPLSMLHYVVRTREAVVLDDAAAANSYSQDDYVRRKDVRSVLCLPLGSQANPVGALYLENNLTPHAFTSDRVALLKMLASQAAISLQNAGLYSDLQRENTDRRRAEEELRRSEAYLQEAQRLGRMGSFVLEPSSGRMIGSAELLRILGRDLDGQGLSLDIMRQYIHAEDREPIEAQRTRAISAKAPWGFAFRIVQPGGAVRYIESVADPVLDAEGAVVEYVGTLIDVTDRRLAEQKLRNAEEALRLAQADLAHASRVNTMGELTAALAHEVNQPITAAVTNANACLRFLSGETPDLEEAREAATAIVHAGSRAAAIISRTREFFRKGVPQKALVDIDDVVRGTVVLLESEARRHAVSIRMWLAAGAPAVLGDHVQLQQVIVNLIMNGIDAMKDVEGVREIAVRTRRTDAKEIVVSVSDAGVGLPSGGADQIFNTFFTTKPEGTGMGLSISRSIVEAHGGRIWAAPNAPRGTTLQFSLPLADEP
jgi:predicted ATPase/signal transduction histidine kinase/GAF domain-containing protein